MITKLSEKYDRVLRYCEKEVDKITKMFKRQREDPPLPRNYSPVAGQYIFFQNSCTRRAELTKRATQSIIEGIKFRRVQFLLLLF